MSNWPRTLMQWLRFENPPQYGKRRMRKLEQDLELERTRNELLSLQKEKLQVDVERMEDVIRSLVLDTASYEEKVRELENKLDTAIYASWSNEQRVSFAFFDYNDPQVDSSTQAIDVSELRADLAEPVLVGKVTQYNPSTGRHDTVELNREMINKEPDSAPVPVTFVFLGVGENGSLSPTELPQLMAVS